MNTWNYCYDTDTKLAQLCLDKMQRHCGFYGISPDKFSLQTEPGKLNPDITFNVVVGPHCIGLANYALGLWAGYNAARLN